MNKRVVITGMGGVTSLGNTWEEVSSKMRQGESGVRYIKEWDGIEGLNTRLGAPVESYTLPKRFKRKQLRGAGRVSKLALSATESALTDANLHEHPGLSNGSTGVAYGSSIGSIKAVQEFGEVLISQSTHSLNSTSYVRMMPHTTAVNLSVVYHVKGRIIPTSCACTSGSLSIGYAYESIKHGYQKLMLAGGAEELDATEAAVFDTLYATSLLNDKPNLTPKPFDQDRDGLVIGEGAATLVLEELEHALERGANIYAEVIGFGTNSDGNHVTQPTQATMEVAMQKALDCAEISPDEVKYISAHAAATQAGDAAESLATAAIFTHKPAISSLKGYFGHTLGACGAIESWLAICGMREGWFPANNNLTTVDPSCGELDYIIGEAREIKCDIMVSNNFAFGGMNTSLVFRKFQGSGYQ